MKCSYQGCNNDVEVRVRKVVSQSAPTPIDDPSCLVFIPVCMEHGRKLTFNHDEALWPISENGLPEPEKKLKVIYPVGVGFRGGK